MKPPNQSSAFFLAYERCLEQRPLPDGKKTMLMIPAVVCLAFSIELGLKALAETEGTNLYGHELAKLFQGLPRGLRDALWQRTGLSRQDFDDALAQATDTFVEWRYVHERENPHANLDFLSVLGRAIQEKLSRQ